MHQNVQSLRNKIDILDTFFCTAQVDVFCVTEHWLDNHEITALQLMGYQLISFYCRQQHIYGGVAIFTKKTV